MKKYKNKVLSDADKKALEKAESLRSERVKVQKKLNVAEKKVSKKEKVEEPKEE